MQLSILYRDLDGRVKMLYIFYLFTGVLSVLKLCNSGFLLDY